MAPELALVMIVASLVLIVVLSTKLKLNMGLLAFVFTFAIGYWVCGLSSTDIAGFFPAKIAVTYILATCFFGYVKRAGVLTGISDRILWLFRKRPTLIPYAVFIASYIVTGLGAGAFATPAIMSPISFALADALGYSPVLAAFAIACATGAGSMFPWMPETIVIKMYAPIVMNEGAADKAILLFNLSITIIYLVAFTVYYMIKKTYKLNRSVDLEKIIKKPEPYTPFQKKVLGVSIGFIILAACPGILAAVAPSAITAAIQKNIDIYILFAFGIVILNAMKIEDVNVVIKEDIPWGALIMICGTAMFFALVNPLGIVDLLAEWGSNLSAQYLVIPFLGVVGAGMSFFVNGMVAVQSLVPIVQALGAVFPGLSLMGMFVALECGTGSTAISPFSTGGAMSLIGAPSNSVREKAIRGLMVCAAINVVILLALSLLGFFNWMTY